MIFFSFCFILLLSRYGKLNKKIHCGRTRLSERQQEAGMQTHDEQRDCMLAHLGPLVICPAAQVGTVSKQDPGGKGSCQGTTASRGHGKPWDHHRRPSMFPCNTRMRLTEKPASRLACVLRHDCKPSDGGLASLQRGRAGKVRRMCHVK